LKSSCQEKQKNDNLPLFHCGTMDKTLIIYQGLKGRVYMCIWKEIKTYEVQINSIPFGDKSSFT